MQILISVFGLAVIVLYLAVKGFGRLRLRVKEKKQLRELAKELRERIGHGLNNGIPRFMSMIEIRFRLETAWHGLLRGGYRLFGFATDKIQIQVNLTESMDEFSRVEDHVNHIILLFLKEKGKKNFMAAFNLTYFQPKVNLESEKFVAMLTAVGNGGPNGKEKPGRVSDIVMPEPIPPNGDRHLDLKQPMAIIYPQDRKGENYEVRVPQFVANRWYEIKKVNHAEAEETLFLISLLGKVGAGLFGRPIDFDMAPNNKKPIQVVIGSHADKKQ